MPTLIDSTLIRVSYVLARNRLLREIWSNRLRNIKIKSLPKIFILRITMSFIIYETYSYGVIRCVHILSLNLCIMNVSKSIPFLIHFISKYIQVYFFINFPYYSNLLCMLYFYILMWFIVFFIPFILIYPSCVCNNSLPCHNKLFNDEHCNIQYHENIHH